MTDVLTAAFSGHMIYTNGKRAGRKGRRGATEWETRQENEETLGGGGERGEEKWGEGR
jgi:hypothetical protein